VLNIASRLAPSNLDSDFKCVHQTVESCLSGMREETKMLLKTRAFRNKSQNLFSYNKYISSSTDIIIIIIVIIIIIIITCLILLLPLHLTVCRV
jgi:hypothetical protein